MRDHVDLLAVFRNLPLFADCTDEELALIDSLADEVHVPAGRVLIREGDIGLEFIVVVSGEAVVTTGDDETGVTELGRIGAGGYVGELALLVDSLQRNATVTAATDMVLEVIDRRGFETLLEDSPGMTLNLLRGTARRLAELDDEVKSLRREH